MKQISNYLILVLLAVFFATACETGDNPEPRPVITVTELTETTGWHGDTIRYEVSVEAGGNFVLEIMPSMLGQNPGSQIYTPYSSSAVTIEYKYVIPETAQDGSAVEINFSASGSSQDAFPVTKTITISEFGGNGTPHTHFSQTITNDTIWAPQNNPHTVDGTVTVKGGSLTIEPGTIILFTDGSKLKTGGADNSLLVADGTAEKPITFSSAADSPQPGDWQYIEFDEGTDANSSLSYCTIEYGGTEFWGIIDIADCSVNINNCVIQNAVNGITLNETAYFESFTGNNIDAAVSISLESVATLGENNTATGGFLAGSGELTAADVLWKAQNSPLVFDGLVEISTNLTIEAGAELQFATNAQLLVGSGNLLAQGSSESPIIFTSAAETPQAGDWQGIAFSPQVSEGSVLDFCTVAYGGSDDTYQGNISVDGTSYLTISNCTITDSQQYGIFLLNGAAPVIEDNNTFSNNASGDVNN